MDVCSFLGHRKVYDVNIDDALQEAAHQVVEEHGTVEFLIYQCGNFYSRRLLAALRERTRCPEKVTITLVLHEDYFKAREKYVWRLEERIPFCIVDKVITPPLETASSRDNTMPYKRMLRWLLENSTCLISCLYQELYERESRLFDCVKNRPILPHRNVCWTGG